MSAEDGPESDRRGLLGAPVTTLLAASWVLVFLALAVARGGPIHFRSLVYGGFISPTISHGFGDVTPMGLYGGQAWRTITATFIHFNLLHLALNLIAFVQLGRVVESWYGSWQTLSLYVFLGAGANLVANLLRPWVSGPSALVLHSGGGSTVVMGLIGLVAVVGWRNPSEFPKRAPFWMLAILLSNAVLGAIVPNIDNLGHASGAAVGALAGLADRRLLRRVKSARARVVGLLALAVLVGSAYCQVDHRRAERASALEVVRWTTAIQATAQVDRIYHELAARGPRPATRIEPRPPNPLGLRPLILPENPAILGAFRAAMLLSLRQLRALPHGFDRPPTTGPYRTVRVLGARATFKPPTPTELATFEETLPLLSRPAWIALTAARRDLARLQQPDPRFGGRLLSRLAPRSARLPAGASASPPSPSAPPRSRTSSGSGPGTR